MHGSTTVLFPIPPLTTNTIDKKQRNRLVRSTRKLGAVLGTTPRVVEPEVSSAQPPIPVALRPQGPRPQGKLRRPATANSEDSAVFGTVSEPTPTFAYTSSSMNSSVASLSVYAEDVRKTATPVHNRKQSLKYSGRRSIETPPPLILHLTEPTTPKHYSLPQTPSTASTLTPGSYTPNDSPALTPLTPVFPTAAESRRKRMAKLTRTLGEKIPPQLVFATKKVSIPSLRSAVSADTPPSSKALFDDKPSGGNRRRSMSVDLVNIANSDLPLASRSSRVWVTGNSVWRGEWNRKDIKDVQKQLRNLKAR